MKVLSLFDGMACGMLAMQAAGIEVDRYVAFEIDKYAVQTSTHNFPMIEHRGDVFKVVSAQNRQRLYWVGKRNPDGTYSRVYVDQPKDRGILLKDILVSGEAWKEKSYTIDSCYYKGGGESIDFKYQACRRIMAAEPVACPFGETDGKSYALTASYWKGQPHDKILEKSQRSHVCEPVGIGYRGRMEDGKWVKRYESNEEEKANALTTAQTDSMVAQPVSVRCSGKTGLSAIPVEFDGDIPIKAVSASDGKTYTVYAVKDGQITIKGKQYPIKLADGYYIIRKLTVSECKRLQTVPEWYEFPVSDTQAYKMLGNGWTVEVIAHLINATQASTDDFDEDQINLFEMVGE